VAHHERRPLGWSHHVGGRVITLAARAIVTFNRYDKILTQGYAFSSLPWADFAASRGKDSNFSDSRSKYAVADVAFQGARVLWEES
jgi:hypothetical protein